MRSSLPAVWMVLFATLWSDFGWALNAAPKADDEAVELKVITETREARNLQMIVRSEFTPCRISSSTPCGLIWKSQCFWRGCGNQGHLDRSGQSNDARCCGKGATHIHMALAYAIT
ncbi:hypothetical protein [Pseudomonas triticicola]|uniref:hypothetical protein n=1 Tax=Pseudomonas triticicola TaxID=2842345 RepID=UPI003EB8EC18